MTGYLMLTAVMVLGTAGAFLLGRTVERHRQNAEWGKILDSAEDSAGVVDSAFRQARQINGVGLFDDDEDGDDPLEEFDRNRARPDEASSITVEGEFDLTLEPGEGTVLFPNGFGVRLFLQLPNGKRDLWGAEIVQGSVDPKPAPSRLIGLWEWELSNLSDVKAMRVTDKVRRLQPGAVPVSADVLEETRQRKPRRSRKGVS